jgi:hypothetical protein
LTVEPLTRSHISAHHQHIEFADMDSQTGGPESPVSVIGRAGSAEWGAVKFDIALASLTGKRTGKNYESDEKNDDGSRHDSGCASGIVHARYG